ncbi:DUF262 domain-containing protein [Acinetobacter sp. HR7]|uniref:DUF262 domain-containing protein n=1 Tax=Acinetobacter sp. HR7 TaxID=1509403 RepID=UPI000537389B|nr:DUF262 domain-containing protein [Acinetobacter sp. HR7]KGT46993.1 hypothetical protein GW12_19590 [Acinetobacter sp. HR7]
MKYNFWSLIGEYSIQIPVIQRDYAQGRQHPKVNMIRRAFIENILQHLDSQQSLELDFIYGAEQDGHLVILDGQQRLTTLFLLHFYLYSLQPSLNHDQKSYFKKFYYETRPSTGDFLESLIANHRICLPHAENTKQTKSISARIKNEGWYFSVWDYDPSIQGMLTMLDEIETQLRAINHQPEHLWQRLTQEMYISFHFLEMKDFKLTDELYIKMNARGVHLSEFENFKAWLMQEIPVEFSSDFFQSLDQEWTDFFWSIKPKNQESIDDILYESFKVTCSGLLALAIGQHADKKSQERASRRQLIEDLRKIVNRDLHQKTYIDLQKYKDCQLFDPKHFQQFYAFMNFLHVLKNEHQAIFNRIRPFIFEDKRIVFQQSYQAYILVFSIFIYCKHKGYSSIDSIQKDLKEQNRQFLDYFNILRRIVINHVHNNLDDYIESITSLNQWAQSIDLNNVIQSLAVLDASKIKLSAGFKKQYPEEKYKAQLIQKGWHQEQLDYFADQQIFHGQIRFLLNWSLDQDQEPNEHHFIQYANKLLNLFKYGLPKEGESNLYLVERLLLCYGDYLPKRTSKYTFCQMNLDGDARSHDENWRLVFNEKSSQVDGQTVQPPLLKQLLDDLPVQFSRQDLVELIERKKQSIHDWRRLCIDFPQTIAYTKNKLLDKTDKEIFLIHQEYRTRFVELRSYCLKLALHSVFKDRYQIRYKDFTDLEFPLSIEIKNDLLHGFIRYDSERARFNTFGYVSQNNELVIQEKSLDEALDILQKMNEFTQTYLSTNVCSEKTHE